MNKENKLNEIYFDDQIVSKGNVRKEFFEDANLNGEMDANTKETKFSDGASYQTRFRDSQRYIDIQNNYKYFWNRAHNNIAMIDDSAKHSKKQGAIIRENKKTLT